MCTNETKIKCPICGDYIDQNKKRIILELCGHSKCRQCFITEENGCVLCNREKQPDSNYYADTADTQPLRNIKNGACERSLECDAIAAETTIENSSSNVTTDEQANECMPIDNRKQINVLDEVIVSNLSYSLSSPEVSIVASQATCKPKTDYPTSTPSHIEVIKVNNGTVFKCRICQKQFKSRNNKKYHFYCDRKLSKPLQCDKCDSAFITTSHLKYHLKTHQTDDLFACTECDRKYLRKTSLKKHLQKHKNELIFKCSECDKRFVYREQLRAHEDKHRNNRYRCDECNECFWSKSNLTTHLLIHSGVRPFKCSDCNKSFNRNSALKSHRLIHSNCRPFACHSCSKTFIDQKSLDRHLRTHTQETVFYECTLCTVKCSRRDNISRHVRNIHSEDNMTDILQTIFQNYAKHNQHKIKTDNVKPKERINATSVIRFAAKCASPVASERAVVLPIRNSIKSIAIPMPSKRLISDGIESRNEMNPLLSHRSVSKLVTNNYQLLSLAAASSARMPTPSRQAPSSPPTLSRQAPSSPPPPPLPPLPPEAMQRPQTNFNINVYRQILSPHIKPSAKCTPKSALTTDSKNKEYDQLALYRKILGRSSE